MKLLSVQYKQVGILVLAQLTMVTVEVEEAEGHFASQKRRAVKSLFRGVILTFRDLVASELIHLKAYRSINACQ